MKLTSLRSMFQYLKKKVLLRGGNWPSFAQDISAPLKDLWNLAACVSCAADVMFASSSDQSFTRVSLCTHKKTTYFRHQMRRQINPRAVNAFKILPWWYTSEIWMQTQMEILSLKYRTSFSLSIIIMYAYFSEKITVRYNCGGPPPRGVVSDFFASSLRVAPPWVWHPGILPLHYAPASSPRSLFSFLRLSCHCSLTK